LEEKEERSSRTTGDSNVTI